MDEERIGGKITFVVGLVLGGLWFIASGSATGEPTAHAVIGFGMFFAMGCIVAAMVGFYNLGRRRGR